MLREKQCKLRDDRSILSDARCVLRECGVRELDDPPNFRGDGTEFRGAGMIGSAAWSVFDGADCSRIIDGIFDSPRR
jgi:hypothetical protein